MGLLRRRRPEPAEPDAAFPFLTEIEGARLRELVRSAFAEAGREVTVHADHVVDSGGQTFGLGNLAGLCHGEGASERRWRKVIREHVDRLLRMADLPSPFDVLSREEILAGTYCRLVAAEDLMEPMTGHARERAPGLFEVFALDTPEMVLFFGDDDVERLGPAEELRAAGMRNLRAVPIDDRDVLSRDGGTVHVLGGESMFVASTLLVLPELLARQELSPDPELGVFVAVPNRHQLDFHVLRDASALPSLQVLVSWALAGFDGAPGPLVPDVYWWRPGRIDRLTRMTDEGVAVEIGPELEDVLDRLGG